MSLTRRAFLGGVAGVFPMMALGAGPSSESRPKRAFVVKSGTGRSDETHRLFDRSWIDFKITTADTAGAFFMIEQRELRRFGPPRHVHPEQDEWFRPLSGTYRAEVGDEKFLIGPGDVLFAPRGVPHVWTHVEEEAGSMMVAFQPAGHMEAFFHAFTRLEQLPPAEELRSLFHAHGMEIIGPPLPLG
jgi:quercetin dioxygenase-like cupin family protein